ncbi:MAG TPA: polysaccharide biosynthesis protein [Gaiellaceae bacterium]|nr:polysaccharide biosynthesis protein [Gaiellaceae bacterium]
MQVPHAIDAAKALERRFHDQYAALLPREERVPDAPRELLEGRRVLVTGADGFLGRRIADRLDELGATTYLTDLHDLDVTDAEVTDRTIRQLRPEFVIHLAAMKHAPLGEIHPLETNAVNVVGTYHVVEGAKAVGVEPGRLVFGSTCKAAAPETVYGATKLLGERIALRAGYSAIRYANVLGSTGSVLEIWTGQAAAGASLSVTECRRYWLTPAEAVGLTLAALGLGHGLYHLDAGEPEPVEDLARRFDPTASLEPMPLRQGDRLVERFLADGERTTSTSVPHVLRILEAWDAA